MKRLAVIGKDVSKSISPEIHSFIAKNLGIEIVYDKVSVAEEDFEKSIEKIIETYDGFNVTVPYKLKVIPHLNSVVGDAKVFGAVNTVDGKNLCGYNTDGAGFMLMIETAGLNFSGKDVLLIGAGGAGRSVAKKLTDAGAKVYVYDKTFAKSLQISKEFNGVTPLSAIVAKPYAAIINASGVGMHATEGISPVQSDIISLCDAAIDLIYVPEKSEFLSLAEKSGKKIINGKAMLFYQAYYSDCIYFGIKPDRSTAEMLFKQFEKVKL